MVITTTGEKCFAQAWAITVNTSRTSSCGNLTKNTYIYVFTYFERWISCKTKDNTTHECRNHVLAHGQPAPTQEMAVELVLVRRLCWHGAGWMALGAHVFVVACEFFPLRPGNQRDGWRLSIFIGKEPIKPMQLACSRKIVPFRCPRCSGMRFHVSELWEC